MAVLNQAAYGCREGHRSSGVLLALIFYTCYQGEVLADGLPPVLPLAPLPVSPAVASMPSAVSSSEGIVASSQTVQVCLLE